MVGPPVEIPGYDPTWNNTVICRLRLQYQFFKLFICQCHAVLCQKCCTVLKMFYDFIGFEITEVLLILFEYKYVRMFIQKYSFFFKINFSTSYNFKMLFTIFFIISLAQTSKSFECTLVI